MNIPFIRLDRQFHSIRDEIMEVTETVFRHGRVLQGPEVDEFESSLSSLFQVPNAVAVNSGTDAITLAFKALGLRQGSRVAVSSISFVASASAIIHAGGVPVFIDVDEHCLTRMDHLLDLIDRDKIDAVLAVDLYGQMLDLRNVYDAAKRHNVLVVQDAAQSIGATQFGKPAGQFADATCVSFDPTKVLGAYGSGGAVLTSNAKVSEKLRSLRYHGHTGNHIYHDPGYNSQLASVQAAILQVKVNHLDEWISRRIEIAEEYSTRLSDLGSVRTPQVLEGNVHTFHKYVLRIPKGRDKVANALKAKEIQTAVHYNPPLHKQPCFGLISDETTLLPGADSASQQVLSLPIYPELTDEEVKYICDAVCSILSG